jgi:hypothetical protein
LAGAVEPGGLGERHEGGRGQALRGAGDHPLNHTAIFLFTPPGPPTTHVMLVADPSAPRHRRGPSCPWGAPGRGLRRRRSRRRSAEARGYKNPLGDSNPCTELACWRFAARPPAVRPAGNGPSRVASAPLQDDQGSGRGRVGWRSRRILRGQKFSGGLLVKSRLIPFPRNDGVPSPGRGRYHTTGRRPGEHPQRARPLRWRVSSVLCRAPARCAGGRAGP